MKTNEFIKHKRTELNLTMKQLAERVGVSEATISRWESGDIGNMRKNNLEALTRALHVTPVEVLFGEWEDMPDFGNSSGRSIPIYGKVAAGIPIETVENIVGYVEISADLKGEYAALTVKGDSMDPQIKEDDTIVVRLQDDADSGDIVVALVDGSEATVKRLLKREDGIVLQPFNPAYEPLYFSSENRSIKIWGRVIESRRKF